MIINTAIKAALEAGEAILKIYAQDFDIEFKADQSPLTSADTASHNIIVQALEETPYPVLSEESATVAYGERKNWKRYWLVDPIDGTKEFIKRSGEFTVNIALLEDGIPILGVVYVPVLDVLYCGVADVECAMPAWKTTGCVGKTLDEIRESAIPLSTSNVERSTNQRALRVVASLSHGSKETTAFIRGLEETWGSCELVSRGSSLKLCMVAEGSADIYPRIAPTMEWDTAAAHAVVKAAGGEVFEYDDTLPVEAYSLGASSSAQTVEYNKENLLNPFFVVSGIGE